MEKIITQIALFRFGVNRFEKKVNEHLADGWNLKELSIVKNWLRIICYAVLKKD
jgi:hypothetical protein